MRSIIASVTAAAVAALLAAAPAFAQERVVNVYNWSDYIDDSTLADFTKETGIKVVYDTFDSNETVETKLLAGGTGYDVVVPTADFLQRQIQAGVFQKLDKSKLPNLSNMWDLIQQRTAEYDPGNEHAVDYMWGTDGIGYNVKKVAEILGPDAKPGLEVIFDPKVAAKFKDCGIYVLDTPKDVITTAFRYLGLDPNSTKAEDFKKAEELLTAMRPYVRKFHSSEYINALANGDICIAFGYSGDMLQAASRAREAGRTDDIIYVIPKEGTAMWADMLAIPRDAKHVDEAHAFINYLMRPDVIAKISDYVSYANANKDATALVDAGVRENPGVYPSPEVMAKLYVARERPRDVQRWLTRDWTRIKSGR